MNTQNSSTQAGWKRAIRKPLTLSVAVATMAVVVATGPAASAQAPATCAGKAATIAGTTGADVLTGTAGNDVIQAFGGDDVVYGGGGNDLICGGHGHDRLYGGDGADLIYAFNGADHIEGGKGPDVIFGGPGKDTLFGNNGADLLKGGPGVDFLNGGAQRDVLLGGLHIDTLFGGTELDTCYSPGDKLNGCEKGGGGEAVVAGPSISVQYANEMFNLINVERAKVAGLAPLTRHDDLDAYARDWAVEMSKQPLPLTSAKHHSPAFTGSEIDFRDLPVSVVWSVAFENVGYSTVGSSETAEQVIDRLFYSADGAGFMTSDGHRCNILETGVTQVGVGSYVDASGDVWVAQVFWGTQSPAPDPISSCLDIAARTKDR